MAPAGRAGPWPGWTSRLLAFRKGGGFVSAFGGKHAGVRGWHTCLRAWRRGGVVHSSNSLLPPGRGLCPLPTPLRGCVAARDEPPSCLRQGRVRGRTGQAAFLRSAKAGVPSLQLGGNTRTCAEDSHRPSASERPKARRKVLCQAFFQESGRRVAARAVPTSWPA